MNTPLTLQQIVAKVEKLPQLPEAAMRLTQMMEDPEASAEDLANIIKLDPDMTTQVLRLCNSASYGLSRKISTVKEAVAILGLKTLKSMVYVIISKFALDRPIEGYGLEKGDLWYNSLTCAVYAKELAQRVGNVDAELAFTGALLKDIGKIILGEFVGPSYKSIEAIAIKNRMDFTEAENRVLGVNHSQVGKQIALKWNLPEDLITVIEFKSRPSAMGAGQGGSLARMGKPGIQRLVTVVHLADMFTKMVGAGMGSDGLMYAIDHDALKAININLDAAFVDSTLAKLVQLNSVVDEMANSLRGGD